MFRSRRRHRAPRRAPRRLPHRGRVAAVLAALLAAVALVGTGTVVGYAAAELEPLAVDCSASQLPPHDGNQVAPACIQVSHGEVAAQGNNPQLLVLDSPRRVRAGEDITLRVSSRNLIRDRFLAAGQGGYYLETGTLSGGITRGHFHAACRPLGRADVAPQPDRNASFRAVEDGGGGPGADTVTVTLPGLAEQGQAQCVVWAGDGSHRTPLMQFANQVPAFDSVRVDVRGEGPRGRARPDDG